MSYKGKNGERSENIVHDIYEQFIAGKGKRQREHTAAGAHSHGSQKREVWFSELC